MRNIVISEESIERVNEAIEEINDCCELECHYKGWWDLAQECITASFEDLEDNQILMTYEAWENYISDEEDNNTAKGLAMALKATINEYISCKEVLIEEYETEDDEDEICETNEAKEIKQAFVDCLISLSVLYRQTMLLPDTVDENYDEEEEEYDDEKEEYFDYNEKSEPVKLNETKETLQQKAMTELEAMLMQQENECLHKWQEKFNGKSATAQYSTMCLKYMERYQLAKLDYLSKNMLLNNYLALIQQNTVRDICAMITSRAMVDINWFKAAQAGDNEWMKQLYEYYHTAAEDEITRVWIYND